MPFQYYVSQLAFSDGTTVVLAANDTVVFVGPNNCGKSRALRDIVAIAQRPEEPPPVTKVIAGAEFVVSANADLDGFLAALEVAPVAHDRPHTYVGRMGATFRPDILLRSRDQADRLRAGLAATCMYHVETENRLHITKPVDAINFATEPKKHPFHYLWDSAELEGRLSDAFSKAFGTDLVFNRFAGAQCYLHVGRRPMAPDGTRHPQFVWGEGYRRDLSALPMLHEQGDGMRSFVGTLMWAVVAEYNVMLLDEPEAFLHPPQARVLGRTLTSRVTVAAAATREASGQAGVVPEADRERQLFVATHSGELLRGMLEGDTRQLRVVRLVRQGEVNRARELRAEQIRDLWSDPILRQSNLLDGLFHARVVLCEGGADCHFYSSVLQALVDGTPTLVNPDVMFINCNGKHRMPTVARALQAVSVPTTVIADFDVLHEEQPLRGLCETLGQDWEDIRTDWNTVRAAISQQRAQLDAAEFVERVRGELGGIGGPFVTDEQIKRVRELAKQASAWGLAKKLGKSFVPHGQPTQAFERLQTSLRRAGLHIVPVGELEGFCREVADHGPAWAETALQRDVLRDRTLREAREFVQGVFWPEAAP